jgi:hypothetical protein
MARKPVTVKFLSKKGGSEKAFFAKSDEIKLRQFREMAAIEANKNESLAEIVKGKVKIDICVNENCGAIHLDHGELEELIKDQSMLSATKKAFLSVFK